MKKILEFLKALPKKIWDWIRKRPLIVAQILNMIVLFIAFGALDETTLAGFITGLWIFLLLGYYIFIKLLGFSGPVKKYFHQD